MSAIQVFKWLQISLNTEKLRSAGSVHPGISKIIMFGRESGSVYTKDFIKVSSKSALSDCLQNILNHLNTSLSNDLGVSGSSCHELNCSGGAIPSLTIINGIRLCKVLIGQQLSAEKPFCNCCSKIFIKGIPNDNKEGVCQQVHQTYYTEPLEPVAFPIQYLYMNPAGLLRRTISGFLHQCHPLTISSLILYCRLLCMPQRC